MPLHRWGAWALVGAVLAAWLVALAFGGRDGAPGQVDQADPALAASDAPVVVIGIPGLTWDALERSDATHLKQLRDEGATAALVLRGTHEVTCAEDAFLTVGAGQRAATDIWGCGDHPGTLGGGTALWTDDDGVAAQPWQRWQEAADRRALGPQLGSLADRVCVASHGELALIGAADAQGKVAHASPDGLGGNPQVADQPPLPGFVEGCAVQVYSTLPVFQGDRPGVLENVDAALTELLPTLPEDSRVIVAGLGHTAYRAEAMAVLLWGPDAHGGLLTSTSTQQAGLIQLTDLTTGALQLLGESGEGLAGGQLGILPGSPERSSELAEGVTQAKVQAPYVLGAAGAVLLTALGIALLARLQRASAVIATGAMAVPAATFAAGLVPWWSARQPMAELTLVLLGIAGLITAIAWAGPWRRHPLGPPAVVGAVTLAVLGVDVLMSARLGLVSVLGLQPVTAGRFFGTGNVGFGIMLGAFLVVAAGLLTWLRRVEAALAVGVLGGVMLMLNAAPQAGADFGGVPGTVFATGLLMLTALGMAWRPRSLILLGVAGALVAAAIMVADWARSAGSRTHLGDFVQSVLDGEALGIVGRKLSQSLGMLVTYPISWAAVAVFVLFVVVVVKRWPSWTAPLWQWRGLRPAMLAGIVAMALTWALNDSGLPAVALTLTMLVTAGVAVLAQGMRPREKSSSLV
ncbi:hypothetical protein ACQBAT_00995 [Ornithinimicrobium sp. Y1847]|uniref:hypothetical protein n=1 Tax=Ornithinimicrobium sp. Y1847 TaxID=3405419 RepID=UPI003B67E5A9